MRRPFALLVRSCSRSSLCLLLALCYCFCLCAGNGFGGMTEPSTFSRDRSVPIYMTSEQAVIPEGIRNRPEENIKDEKTFFPILQVILWASLFSLCTRLLPCTPHNDLLPRQTDIRGLLPLPTAPPRAVEPSAFA